MLKRASSVSDSPVAVITSRKEGRTNWGHCTDSVSIGFDSSVSTDTYTSHENGERGLVRNPLSACLPGQWRQQDTLWRAWRLRACRHRFEATAQPVRQTRYSQFRGYCAYRCDGPEARSCGRRHEAGRWYPGLEGGRP